MVVPHDALFSSGVFSYSFLFIYFSSFPPSFLFFFVSPSFISVFILCWRHVCLFASRQKCQDDGPVHFFSPSPIPWTGLCARRCVRCILLRLWGTGSVLCVEARVVDGYVRFGPPLCTSPIPVCSTRVPSSSVPLGFLASWDFTLIPCFTSFSLLFLPALGLTSSSLVATSFLSWICLYLSRS